MGDFKRCSDWTLSPEIEGGRSDHAADRGGLTHYGIAEINHAAAFGTRKPSRTLAVAWAYRERWLPIRGDALREPLDLVVFDAAFHSTPKRSVQRLQKLLGFTGGEVDGLVGPKTLAALERRDPRKLAALMIEARWYALVKQMRDDVAAQWAKREPGADVPPMQLDFAGGWGVRMIRLRGETTL